VQITVLNYHTAANNVRLATRTCAPEWTRSRGPGAAMGCRKQLEPPRVGFHGKAALTRLHRGCIVVERPLKAGPALECQFPTSTICALDGTPVGLRRNSIYAPGGTDAPVGGAVAFRVPAPPFEKLSGYAP